MAVGSRPVAVGGVALAALPLAFSLSSSSSHTLLPPLILFRFRGFFLVDRFVRLGFVRLGFVCAWGLCVLSVWFGENVRSESLAPRVSVNLRV